MIRLDSISKQHGQQILFIEASAALNRGEKVGLVGPNGAGKTTLFRMIMARSARRRPGRRRSRRDHRLLQPGRRRDGGPQRRSREAMAGAGAVAEVAARAARSSRHALADPDARRRAWTSIVERFGEVQARFDELGGYALEGARARDPGRARASPRDDGRRRRQAVGRLEDARGAGADPADAARRAAARRADQPPRPRKSDLARAAS